MPKINKFDSTKDLLKELDRADGDVVLKLPFKSTGFKSTKNPFKDMSKIKVKERDGKEFKYVKLTKKKKTVTPAA